jgi:HlyD family secretion protein
VDASTAASRSASRLYGIGQAGLDGQVQVLGGLNAGDEVVVYSEKAITASSRIKVVDQLAGSKP